VVSALRIAPRGSALALIQARLVEAALRRLRLEVELVPVVSAGDVRAAGTAPGEGVFVRALESALLAGEADLAVHSAKDMPLEAEPELVVAAYPERADPRDALVGATLASAGAGARIGTDSWRRAGFLLRLRPDLRHHPLHGNVDTRLGKLDAGETDLLVLAAAVTADGATYHSVVLRGALGEAPRLAAEAGQELLAHVPLEPPP